MDELIEKSQAQLSEYQDLPKFADAEKAVRRLLDQQQKDRGAIAGQLDSVRNEVAQCEDKIRESLESC